MVMINTILYLLLIKNVLALKSCIVLFTGGSNIMSPSIYTDFLSHIQSDHKVIKMSFLVYTKDMRNNYIEELDKTYDIITYLAHSSGATTAINQIHDRVDRLILMDPVATPNIDYNINLDTLDSINIINADLSYKWSYKPPFLPFIPIFKLDPGRLNINNDLVTIETIDNYGHSDLIDKPYRDIMHFTGISRGNPDRKRSIYNYHNLLFSKINNIIYEL